MIMFGAQKLWDKLDIKIVASIIHGARTEGQIIWEVLLLLLQELKFWQRFQTAGREGAWG